MSDFYASILNSSDSPLYTRLDEVMEMFGGSDWKEPSEFFSVSKLFFCERGAFCARAGVKSQPDALSVLRMSLGTALHTVLQEMFREQWSGFGLDEAPLRSDDPPILGHPDGILMEDGLLLEIKTVGYGSAKSIRTNGIPKYYQDQAQSYLGLFHEQYSDKLDGVWFLVLDIGSSKWVEQDVIKANGRRWSSIKKRVSKLQKMWEAGKLPPIPESCNTTCDYYGYCPRANSLSDLLPGGSLRKESD